jgi:hypothetical protein
VLFHTEVDPEDVFYSGGYHYIMLIFLSHSST